MLLNKAAAARMSTGRWTESPDLNVQPWKIICMPKKQTLNYFL